MRTETTIAVIALAVVFADARVLAVDCNSNGVPDETDIAGGTSGDFDTNGVPDECEMPVGGCFGYLYACSSDGLATNTGTTPSQCFTLEHAVDYVNTWGLEDHVEVRLLNDGNYHPTLPLIPTHDGDKDHYVLIQGRNEGNTADEQVTILGTTDDANIWNCQGDFWIWSDIHSGTLQIDGSPCNSTLWAAAGTVTGLCWVNCKGTDACKPWNLSNTGSAYLVGCEVDGSHYTGFVLQKHHIVVDSIVRNFKQYASSGGIFVNSAVHNGLGKWGAFGKNHGFHHFLAAVNCSVWSLDDNGVAFFSVTPGGSLCLRTIAAEAVDGAYGGPVGGQTILVEAADYDSGGRIGGNALLIFDVDGVSLTGNPFVDAENGNLELNKAAGAGGECRNSTGVDSATGTYTSYRDMGAAQSKSRAGGRQFNLDRNGGAL